MDFVPKSFVMTKALAKFVRQRVKHLNLCNESEYYRLLINRDKDQSDQPNPPIGRETSNAA